MTEINACKLAFPEAYIRLSGFDADKQVQTASMLVHRPPNSPAISVRSRSVDGASLIAKPLDFALENIFAIGR